MKLKMFEGLVLLCLFTTFLTKDVMSYSETIDQKCRVTSDQMGFKSITNVAYAPQQSFIPTYDHLTKISIYVNGDGVGTIKLWLVEDWAGGNFFTSSSGNVAEPNGKAMVNFTFDNLLIKPGKSYLILPGSTDYSKLDWYNQENCYANGSGHLGDVEQTFDFAFQTYGYNSSFVPSELPISMMPVYTLSTPTPIIIKFPTITPTPTSTTKFFFPKRTISPTSIATSATPVPTINLSSENDYELTGTGEKGSKILVTIGKNTYDVIIDDNGQWSIKLPISETDNGTYTVTAQTEIGDTSGKETTPIKDSKYYPYIIGLLIALIVLTVLGMINERPAVLPNPKITDINKETKK